MYALPVGLSADTAVSEAPGSQISIEPSGIISILNRGLWDVMFAERHFQGLSLMVQRRRAEGRPILALVDSVDDVVQPAAVHARIGLWVRMIYRPEDRIAMLARSSLKKIQMKTVPQPCASEVFISANAARTWLLAYSPLAPDAA